MNAYSLNDFDPYFSMNNIPAFEIDWDEDGDPPEVSAAHDLSV